MRSRKRSDNLNNGSFVRKLNRARALDDQINAQRNEEEFVPRKQRRTNNVHSIAFEQRYYPERYR